MTNNAQEWLNRNYPRGGECTLRVLWNGKDNENFGKNRNQITTLDIGNNGLQGPLILEGFTNLEILRCSSNRITSLQINNNSKLKIINGQFNQITGLNLQNFSDLESLVFNNNELMSLDLSQNKKIERLEVMDNNLLRQNFLFSKGKNNLKIFLGGNWNRGRINENKYNRFNGSLGEFFKDMIQLKTVDVRNTDFGSDNFYLFPISVENFHCLANIRENAKVKEIYDIFTDEKGEVELTNFDGIDGFIKDFSVKFQAYKSKVHEKKIEEARDLLKDEIRTLTEKIRALTAQLTATENNISQTTYDDLVKERNQLKTELGTAQTNNDNLMIELNQVKTNLSKEKSTYLLVQKELIEANKEIQRLQEKLGQSRNNEDYENLLENNKKISQELAEVKEELKKAQEEVKRNAIKNIEEEMSNEDFPLTVEMLLEEFEEFTERINQMVKLDEINNFTRQVISSIRRQRIAEISLKSIIKKPTDNLELESLNSILTDLRFFGQENTSSEERWVSQSQSSVIQRRINELNALISQLTQEAKIIQE